MFGTAGADSHHPLLPAKHQAKRRATGRLTPAGTQRRRRRLLAASGLALVAAAAVLLYRWAPQLRSGEAASAEEARRDEERELQLLHEQPSQQFCALPPPRVCAHGGDATAAPPNTAAAFAAALAGGARCVEVDVARSKDGQLVVLHTRELAHLLHLAGADVPAAPASGGLFRRRRRRRLSAAHAALQVADFTWAELQRLRWEEAQGVELVEAVLHMVLHSTDQITLDVKTHMQAGEDVDEDSMAQAVVDLVRRTDCSQCLVWAKSDVVVQMVKELDPGQLVGYVVVNETAAARAAGMHHLLRMPGAEVIAMHYAMASDPLVTSQARIAGKQVHAWTANTAGMMRSVLDAGVEAVVTNHPRKLQEAVDSRLQRCRRQRQERHREEGQQDLEQQAGRRREREQQQEQEQAESGRELLQQQEQHEPG